MTASPSFAAEAHPYTGTSFGPDGVGGSASFANLQSIAVDQASGNVFAYDAGEGKVYKFDSAGAPLNFSGLSGNAIEGVVGVGGSTGNGEFEIAVAPPGAPGGTAGDIYVADNSNSLRIFSAAGAPLGEIAIGQETCGVAVNPDGHVFVGIYSSVVKEFVPTANPPTLADESPTESSDVVSAICNVAADGLGNVYAAGYSSGPVYRLEGLGDTSADVVDAAANTMAVDPTTNDLYTDRRSEFAQYDSAGNLIGISGAGQLTASSGIAVHGASETVYAANGGTKVDVFGPSVVVFAATSEPATGVTGSKATLHGSVSPAGLAVTECVFEYGETASYGQSKPCEGALPADEADHPVTAVLTGLSPSATYHFRISATNANGTTTGGDETFTTKPPAVTGNATAVAGSKATLNGTVFPEGEAITECFFEYGISESFGSTAPCEGATPADEGEHPVTAQLTNLTPNGTTYFFRLVINRAAGIARGGNRSFQTEPTVITGAPTAVSVPNATLNGTVNPEGAPFDECLFEYGTSTAYGQSAPCAESPAEIGEGTGFVPVHADVSDLTFGATYHYRLTATNADGIVRGADESFSTPGAVIEAQWASNVDQREATLKAEINPAGSPTTYHVEYGTDLSYGSSTAENSVGADGVGHIVTNLLQGLAPGTTYHFRFVATNSVGVSKGPDRTFTTSSVSSLETNCQNQAFRVGASASLPDCRAYEMVSPVDKNNGDLISICNSECFRTQLDQSSIDGEKFTYSAYKAFADTLGAPYSSQYIASRSPSGWATRSITLPRDQGLFNPVSYYWDLEAQYKAFTSDLSMGWVTSDNLKPINPDAASDNVNLYARDNTNNTLQTLTLNDPSPKSTYPAFLIEGIRVQGHSLNGDHLLFWSRANLLPSAPDGGLYDFSGGALHLVGVLPDGTVIADAEAGSCDVNIECDKRGAREHAVSDDGSRVFWSHAGDLYVRIDNQTTLPISTDKEAYFRMASADGSKVLYHTAASQEFNEVDRLYEYNLDTEATTLIADEVRGVLGASEDLSYIYFVSREALAAGGTAGGNNLYLDHDGTVTFVASLSAQDVGLELGSSYVNVVNQQPINRPARVTPDGRHIAFESTSSLTGYDNTDASTKKADLEVFTYDADSGRMICASCNPAGTRPIGEALRKPYTANDSKLPYQIGAASWLPTSENALYSTRPLSNDGKKLFFNSFESLVPNDNNSQQDVYEWEAQGVGGCGEADGCIRLLSSGDSPGRSEFIDADPTGRDVFFETKSSLLPQDPGLVDIYNAREGGGFPPPPSVPASCEGEACQGPLIPRNDPTPASSTFQGAGNVRADKKQKKNKSKKKRKGSGKKRGHDRSENHRGTNTNRGAQR